MRRTSNLIPLLLSYGIVTIFLAMYWVFAPYWLEEGFQETSYFKITLIAGIPTLVTVVGANLWGIIADHFQKRRVLVSMAAIAAALQYLLLAKFVTSFMPFLLVVSFFPLFYSAMQTAAPTLATLLHEEKGKASGLFVTAGSMGWFIGGLLGGIFYPSAGMRWLLTVAFVLCVIAGIVIHFSEDPEDHARAETKSYEAISWSKLLKMPQITVVIGTMLLLQIGNNVFYGLSTNYFIRIVGMSTFHVGLATAVAALIGTILSTPLGNYMEKYGRRNIFLIGVATYPVGLFAIFLGRYPWIITAIYSYPFYLLIWTSGVAIMADLTQPSERAKAIGLFFASLSFGQAVGTVLGGIIADHFGLRILIVLPIPTGIGAFLLAYFLLEESLQKPNL